MTDNREPVLEWRYQDEDDTRWRECDTSDGRRRIGFSMGIKPIFVRIRPPHTDAETLAKLRDYINSAPTDVNTLHYRRGVESILEGDF